MAHYPLALLQLIDFFTKLPGVGTKTAERYAFAMLRSRPQELRNWAETLMTLHEKVVPCRECSALVSATAEVAAQRETLCAFCASSARDARMLCVVAHPRDVFAIENTKEYKGLYHVLGGLLSPMEGIGPEGLRIAQLVTRIRALSVQELIIGLDSTVEGDATALYIKQELEPFGLKIARLAFGLPLGSALEYVHGDTLARAFSGRRVFN